MPAHHEHYLQTEGAYNPGWFEPTTSSLGDREVWRFPYLVEVNGQRHARALEVDEMIRSNTTEFVGRLATGWLVTVSGNDNGYSIHLALEQTSLIANEAAAAITEAERITEIAAVRPQRQLAAAA